MLLRQLTQVPAVLEQQHRPVPGIPHRLAIKDPPHLLQRWPAARHPASHRKTERFKPRLHAVFVLKPVLHHLQLQLAHRRQNRIALAFICVVEDLHRPLLAQLVDTLAEALECRWVGVAQPGKDLRREARNPLVFHLLAQIKGVANGEHARVIEADHIAGVGVLHHLPVLAEKFLGA